MRKDEQSPSCLTAARCSFLLNSCLLFAFSAVPAGTSGNDTTT